MKPYRPSQHQVGYTAPRSTEVSPRMALKCLLAIVVLGIVLSVFAPEPVSTSCAAPAQVASQK